MLERVEEAGAPAPEAEAPSMTLGTYLAEAGRALRTTLPRAWVEAVVLDAKDSGRGVSLELVEPLADERHNGVLRSMIWSRTAAKIEADIGEVLDATTLKGCHVRLLIKTVFHPRHHLQGEVLDIDPTIVRGLIAKREEAIRQALRQAGLFGAQQALAQPEEITNVAVIHPDRSAGWADVHGELERLQERGIIQFQSHPVPFEGAASAAAIADALSEIAHREQPDIVLIVRGGGAASGLAALTNLTLARAVCLCPVPIVTGLGHASDNTILDDLAWRSADTPSKALGVVKSILRQRSMQAREDHRLIVEAMDRLIGSTLQPLLSASRDALGEAAEKITAVQAARLRQTVHGVERTIVTVRGSIDLRQAHLDHLAEQLLATVPLVPRGTARGLTSLYAGIARTTRRRLPEPEVLSAEVHRSAGAVAAFVARQAADLRSLVGALENGVRRRLAEEGARLSSAAAETQALDVTAVLKRGFVLPLDRQRRIIRSVRAAQDADPFELLFADGLVACRLSMS